MKEEKLLHFFHARPEIVIDGALDCASHSKVHTDGQEQVRKANNAKVPNREADTNGEWFQSGAPDMSR